MLDVKWDWLAAGQSQPPCHLSMFLEVSDKEATADWSCFVSHRLVIVNQRDESRSLVKESQVLSGLQFCSIPLWPIGKST